MHMPTVALVGRRLEHNENLGLAYLEAALVARGARVRVHRLNDGGDLAAVALRVLEEPPDVLGLSLADGGSAFLPLALGELCSSAGFAGHVTCGGQFATLARAWLLERYGWLDSVVRFAGERPLGELVERLARGLPVEGVPGLTTRAGDGPPAPVLDPLPLELTPLRRELPEILGYPAAHVAATRGCAARCDYCGPAALQRLELHEGRRARHEAAELRASGVGGVRRRELERLCDEMASLWHERGVRYFYFVDEHLLPYREDEALGFVAAWRAGLAARSVGRFGVGGMLRADRLTPALAHALADLGLVRVFVGLELATAAEGARFGRPAPGERELEIVATFARLGVATVSNLMLVHPYSTLETIGAGIALLERLPHGVFEATRMMVYHGTRLHSRLAAEGRLTGNPLRWGYSFADEHVERFATVFAHLRGEAFHDYSLACRVHDTHLAAALAARLRPEREPGPLGARLEETRRAVNALYVEAYRRALDACAGPVRPAETRLLVAEMRARCRPLEDALEEVALRLARDAPRRGQLLSPMRAAAAGALGFALLSPAGCGNGATAAAPLSGPTPEPTVVLLAGPPDAGPDAGPLPPAEPSAEPPSAPPASAELACPPPDGRAPEDKLRALLDKHARCFSGWVDTSRPPAEPRFSVHGVHTLRVCNGAEEAVEARARQVLTQPEGLCAVGAGVAGGFGVEGGASKDMERMANAIRGCSAPNGFEVLLDGRGQVVDVRSTGAPPPLVQCVRSALRGLTFPCLASFAVCPEWVIVE